MLSKYDKSSFNSAANDDEMSRLEQTASFKIPEELKEIYRIADGFQILGRTAHIYSLSNVGCKLKDIPDEYVEHGNVDILRREVGIDADTIERRILESL